MGPRKKMEIIHTSMYQSCLRPKHLKSEPQMTAHHAVEDALKQDAQDHYFKYGLDGTKDGTQEPSQDASLSAPTTAPGSDSRPLGMGRFCVRLPQTPQHNKFSLTKDKKGERSRTQSKHVSHASVRFDKATLMNWFRQIDVNASGSISQREFIVALRKHKDLQAILSKINGSEMDDEEKIKEMDTAAKTEARRGELRRLKKILSEIDEDHSGSMEWDEFVEFFRRAGFLLEYETHHARNSISYEPQAALLQVVKEGCEKGDFIKAEQKQREFEASRKLVNRGKGSSPRTGISFRIC